MSDVKLERKESVSHSEAAEWLSVLSRAFTQGGHADLPFGPAQTHAGPGNGERKSTRSAKSKRR